MNNFVKPFRGVPLGQIYPVTFNPGDVCPDELLTAAVQAGAVAVKKPAKAEKPDGKSLFADKQED